MGGVLHTLSSSEELLPNTHAHDMHDPAPRVTLKAFKTQENLERGAVKLRIWADILAKALLLLGLTLTSFELVANMVKLFN
jgi:hypothetical protein